MKESRTAFFYYLFDIKKIKTSRQLVLVIGTHLVAWLLFFTLPAFFFRIQIANRAFLYKELVNKVFLIGFFYLNYFFLIPRFFIRGKRATYCLLLFGTVLLLFVQHLACERAFMGDLMRGPVPGFMRFGARDAAFMRAGMMRPPVGPEIFSFPERLFFMVLTNVLSSTFFLVLLGGFIHLAFFFLKSQDEKRTLENASLKAEINLLKSQINPHFLFNTLNSIYSQVYHRSANAELSILKLSEILRYVIYESAAEKIGLQKDIHYLVNYIDLQRLRLSDKVQVHFSVRGELEGLSIAPLLLITFIENAFKHGISYRHSSEITIDIGVFAKTLTLIVRNPVVGENTFEHQGVGLKNAIRRLQLIYPGSHSLDVVHDDYCYVVNLKIDLNRD